LLFTAVLNRSSHITNQAPSDGEIYSLPEGAITATKFDERGRAIALVSLPGDNNDLRLVAREAGDELNGVTVQILDRGPNDTSPVSWNPVAKTLSLSVQPSLTANPDYLLLTPPDVSATT